jgi:hypothetical protein
LLLFQSYAFGPALPSDDLTVTFLRCPLALALAV